MYTNDEKKLKEAIVKAFPEFSNSLMAFNHSGWTSVVVEIDGKLICKFPRNKEKHEHLKSERKLIELLNEHLDGYEFPRRKAIISKYPFFIHRKIEGEHFTKERYEQSSLEEQDAFKKSVADFLVHLHKLPVSLFEGFIPFKDEKLPDLSEMDALLEQDFSKEDSTVAKSLLREFNDVSLNRNKVVGHFDMHAYNFVVAPNTKKVKGFFDFDEFAIGSQEFDLREFELNFGSEISQEIISIYNDRANVAVDLETLRKVHNGWSIYEYIRTKKRLSQDLKDVGNINMVEYRNEIKNLIKKAKVG